MFILPGYVISEKLHEGSKVNSHVLYPGYEACQEFLKVELLFPETPAD